MKRFFARASQPFGGDPRLARLADSHRCAARRAARGRRPRAARVGARSGRESARAQRDAARGRAHRASGSAGFRRCRGGDRASARRIPRWCASISCSSPCSSPARCRSSRRGTRRASSSSSWSASRPPRAPTKPSTASCSSSSRPGRCRRATEKIAREQLQDAVAGPGPGRDRRRGRARDEAGRDRSAAARARAARARCRRCRAFARSLRVRVHRCCCSSASLGRSLYLQWIDNEFLQEQGSSRYSREIELPAHRGRIVDRYGDALAISTPVKSIWAFPAKVEATPEQLAALARAARNVAAGARASSSPMRAISCSSRGRCRRKWPTASRALEIKGIHDQNEYRRFYPGGETMSHVLGFTGDHDAGQEGHRARAAGMARRQAGQPPRDHQPARRRGRGRRGDSRAAGRTRPRALDRHAAAVPRVPRAQGRGRGQQGEGGRPRDPRRRTAARSSRSPTGRRTTRTRATGSRASGCATAR